MNKDGLSKVFIFLIHSSACNETTRLKTGSLTEKESKMLYNHVCMYQKEIVLGDGEVICHKDESFV